MWGTQFIPNNYRGKAVPHLFVDNEDGLLGLPQNYYVYAIGINGVIHTVSRDSDAISCVLQHCEGPSIEIFGRNRHGDSWETVTVVVHTDPEGIVLIFAKGVCV